MPRIPGLEEELSPLSTDLIPVYVVAEDKTKYVQIANVGIGGPNPDGSEGDLQRKNGTALEASGINDDGTVIGISRKRMRYTGIPNNPIFTAYDEVATANAAGGIFLSVVNPLSGNGGVLVEALLTASWTAGGVVETRTLKPSKQFTFDSVNGNSSTTQQDLEDSELNPDDAVTANLGFSAGSFYVEPIGVAATNVHWTVRLELTVSKAP
jgi:hypothetical protein